MTAEILSTGIDSPTMEKRVAKAYRKLTGSKSGRPVYEHGQWWVLDPADDGTRTFAAEDGVGPGTYDGICFEEVG